MKILRPRDGYDLRFVFERMQLIAFPLGEHNRYWISEYRHRKIEMPQLGEQTAIAEVLRDASNEIASLQVALRETET